MVAQPDKPKAREQVERPVVMERGTPTHLPALLSRQQWRRPAQQWFWDRPVPRHTVVTLHGRKVDVSGDELPRSTFVARLPVIGSMC